LRALLALGQGTRPSCIVDFDSRRSVHFVAPLEVLSLKQSLLADRTLIVAKINNLRNYIKQYLCILNIYFISSGFPPPDK
jgi:hypothetical protein